MKLEQVLSEIEKKLGKEIIVGNKVDVEFVSSGSIGLDVALGGGFAKGRVVEIFGWESSGKTTIALHLAAEIQKLGGAVAYVDMEQAMDLDYAESLNVEVDFTNKRKFLLSQPDNGEEALQLVKELLHADEIQLIVFDSVGALNPKAKMQGDVGDAKMGLEARLMSSTLPMLISGAKKTGCIIVFINQKREKIGVMFGCFDYKTSVVLEDGSTEWIGKIVNQKLPVKVMSFNKETGKCESKKILNYYSNGKADQFLKFTIEKPYGNGRSQFSCTKNHLIFTPNGEIPAGDLKIGDVVLGKDIYRLSDLQKEIIYGSLLGDGYISARGRFIIGHGQHQIDYCKWKQTFFDNIVTCNYSNNKGGYNFETIRSAELSELRRELYIEGGRVLTESFINKLTPLSLAIWYMDDACLSGSYKKWGNGKIEISIKKYTFQSVELLIKRLNEFNLYPTYTKRKTLLFSGEESNKIQTIVSKFIHPSMNYKLTDAFKNNFMEFLPIFIDCYWNMRPMSILNINHKCLDSKYMTKFDLEIEDNHNYLVDGIGVHNSPETTMGGNALKFYASQRLDVSRIGQEKDGDDIIANKTRVKIVKNKVAVPFKKAEFSIEFGVGIDKIGEIIDLATECEIIKKSGSWYAYGETKLGQGASNVKLILQDNPELLEEIENKVRVYLGLLEK